MDCHSILVQKNPNPPGILPFPGFAQISRKDANVQKCLA